MAAKYVRVFSGVFLVIIMYLAQPVVAGDILNGILSRGILRCGVDEHIPGFSELEEKAWKGFNVDFCRALAAAVLGDPSKVEFIPLTASMQFPALQLGNADVIVRNTKWTLRREAILKVRFPAVLYFDTQVIMVREDAKYSSAQNLNKARICVQSGTNHALNLESYFDASKVDFHPIVVDSFEDMIAEFISGRCDGCTGDASKFFTLEKQPAPGLPNFHILPAPIAIQPLCPVIWGGDSEWATTIRLVLYALTVAEELGITKTNIDSEMSNTQLKSWTLLRERQPQIAESLGIHKEWAVYAIKTAGNYGEMYDRNLGNMSRFHIQRGLNRLWRDGGLMYSPPFE